MAYWLFKSEPSTYSIDDLKRDGCTHWDGVRNYQARNKMREMRIGDRVLFYHSGSTRSPRTNAHTPGVVGTARIAKEAYPDHTQFDTKSPYYDPKSSKENPRWNMVDICFEEAFPRCVPLSEIKARPAFSEMELVTRPRLSVQSVSKEQFERICTLGNTSARSAR